MAKNKSTNTKPKKKEINPVYRAFALEYVDCLNQTKAYMLTHPKASKETAYRAASALMRNHEVRALIEAEIEARHMGKNEVLARYAAMARGDLTPFLKVEDDTVYFDFANPEAKNYMHLVKKISTTNRVLRTKRAGKGADAITEELVHQWVAVELHDPQAALLQIGRHYKLFTDRVESDHHLYVDGLDQMMEKIYGSDDHGRS